MWGLKIIQCMHFWDAFILSNKASSIGGVVGSAAQWVVAVLRKRDFSVPCRQAGTIREFVVLEVLKRLFIIEITP